jgi:hypothetical protein
LDGLSFGAGLSYMAYAVHLRIDQLEAFEFNVTRRIILAAT